MPTPPTKAILFDLCGVLLVKRAEAGLRTIETATGWSGNSFWEAYWAERVSYDAGCPGQEYWERVSRRLGRPLLDPAAAIEADVTSCAAPDHRMIALVGEFRRLPAGFEPVARGHIAAPSATLRRES